MKKSSVKNKIPTTSQFRKKIILKKKFFSSLHTSSSGTFTSKVFSKKDVYTHLGDIVSLIQPMK